MYVFRSLSTECYNSQVCLLLLLYLDFGMNDECLVRTVYDETKEQMSEPLIMPHKENTFTYTVLTDEITAKCDVIGSVKYCICNVCICVTVI